MKKLAWVGLDVHQDYTSIAVVDGASKVLYEGRCITDANKLVKILEKFKGYKLECCYEASGIGFTLQRQLESRGYDCLIVAPGLIPKKAADAVKTDRRDALRLAQYLRTGLLTPIHILTEQEEIDRNLVRAREQLAGDVKRLKLRILSAFRSRGWNYIQERGSAGVRYWTGIHRRWIKSKLEEIKDTTLHWILVELLTRLEYLENRMNDYNQKIEDVSTEPRYRNKVRYLCCFRGIKTLSAMVIITELGDIRRFDHPRPLMSFIGLGVREKASGNIRNQGGLTKTGNRRVRWILTEAAQYAKNRPLMSNFLKERRKGVRHEIVSIADKCMERLHGKYWHLQNRGKHTNKIKSALAREMVGFIWDVLRKTA